MSITSSFDSKQTLTNNHAMLMLNVDQNLPIGLSYYVSAGLTDLYSTIGDYNDNQISPMAYYGAYLCSQSKTRFFLKR